MEKLKEFCKNHKSELIIAGCVVGGTIVVLSKGRLGKRRLIDITGKSCITWTKSHALTMEQAKRVLELSADDMKSCYAIVKDPGIPTGYELVLLNKVK